MVRHNNYNTIIMAIKMIMMTMTMRMKRVAMKICILHTYMWRLTSSTQQNDNIMMITTKMWMRMLLWPIQLSPTAGNLTVRPLVTALSRSQLRLVTLARTSQAPTWATSRSSWDEFLKENTSRQKILADLPKLGFWPSRPTLLAAWCIFFRARASHSECICICIFGLLDKL